MWMVKAILPCLRAGDASLEGTLALADRWGTAFGTLATEQPDANNATTLANIPNSRRYSIITIVSVRDCRAFGPCPREQRSCFFRSCRNLGDGDARMHYVRA